MGFSLEQGSYVSALANKSASSAYTIMLARRSWGTSSWPARSREAASRENRRMLNRRESIVACSNSRISRISSSSRSGLSTERSLSRSTVSKARERSIPRIWKLSLYL
uniref:Uncharacterized protein n=1 Tax=Hyaloperonospora arabidopsidis (strain Emoy2) TaxID=559515 RepID=M4C5N8_HYAAE